MLIQSMSASGSVTMDWELAARVMRRQAARGRPTINQDSPRESGCGCVEHESHLQATYYICRLDSLTAGVGDMGHAVISQIKVVTD